MKNSISLLLALAMCLSLVACAVEAPPETTATVPTTQTVPATTVPTEPPIPTAQLKETVSTDIVDFTLEHSKLTYYVSNSSTNFVEATDEANSLFAAKMGTCYVSMTVTIKNKDRGGSLAFCGGFSAWDAADWSVTYNGEEYEMYGFDLNSDNYDSIKLSYGALVDKTTGKVLTKIDTGNKLISAGETMTLRFFGIIKVDPQTLNDGFELNVKVPNSKGEYENFKYIVPAIS